MTHRFATLRADMSLAQRLFVGAGFVVGIVTAVYMLSTASDLPSQIPMGYDGDGAVTWYADRSGFWLFVIGVWFVGGAALLAGSVRSVAAAFGFFWVNVTVFFIYDLTYHQGTGGGIIGLTPGVFVLCMVPGFVAIIVLALREARARTT